MIKAKNIFKYYEHGMVKAVNGLSLNIEKGESYSIMGPSGCGKTTLLNMIGALDTPTKGNIYFNDRNLKDIKNISQYRNINIGFIFQFHNLIPNLSIVENVELPTYANLSLNNEVRRKMALDLLEDVGLLNKSQFPPTKLSGGQRQLVAVARSLINLPKIILADEPTGNVDSKTAENIMSILLDKCKMDGISLVIVSHNREIANICSKKYEMQDGKFVDNVI